MSKKWLRNKAEEYEKTEVEMWDMIAYNTSKWADENYEDYVCDYEI